MGDSVSFSAGDKPAESAFAERLAAYRSLREQIERSILPLATSVDGMVFEFQASLHGLAVRRGYVMLGGDGTARLGRLDTGTLGVVAVTARTGAEAAALITRSTVGLGHRDPNIHQLTTESFEVRSRSGRAFAGIDGESLDLDTPLEFRVHPQGLRVGARGQPGDRGQAQRPGARPRRPRRGGPWPAAEHRAPREAPREPHGLRRRCLRT